MWTGSLQLLFVTELKSKRLTEYNFRWYFQRTFLKIKNVGKIKNVKKRALNKKRKKRLLHLCSKPAARKQTKLVLLIWKRPKCRRLLTTWEIAITWSIVVIIQQTHLDQFKTHMTCVCQELCLFNQLPSGEWNANFRRLLLTSPSYSALW